MFLLPMVVAAFTKLVAQIEHRARGWDHLLALPIARWKLFTAKAIIVVEIAGFRPISIGPRMIAPAKQAQRERRKTAVQVPA